MSEKKRQTNFNEAEKLLVIDFVKKYVSVLENKSGAAQFLKEKQDTWKKCEDLFRSKGYYRSWRTLRDLYFRMKIQAKSKISNYKKSLQATGEEPRAATPTEIEWRIYSIISQDFEKDTDTDTFDSDSEMILNAPVVKLEETTDDEISLPLPGPMTAFEKEMLRLEVEERGLRVKLLEKQIVKQQLKISNLRKKHDLEKEILQLQIKKLREN